MSLIRIIGPAEGQIARIIGPGDRQNHWARSPESLGHPTGPGVSRSGLRGGRNGLSGGWSDGSSGDPTVDTYIRAAKAAGLKPDGPPLEEGLLAALLQQRRPGPAIGRATGQQELVPYQEQIARWVREDRLQLTRVWELLDGVSVSYTTLRRFVHQMGLGRRARTTVRMAETAPGEVAEFDFGRLGYLVDPDTGKRQLVWALVVVLPYSRHSFVWPLVQQTLQAVIEGLEAAWRFLGGVPQRLVLDNFPAAVAGYDPLAPRPTRGFLEYSQARGFLVDPARVRHPQDKPHVERGIAYVLGEEPYDVPVWRTVTVHPDHHVSFGSALYSVPARSCPPGTKLEARGDRSLVRLYRHGELVKVHPRQPKGGRSTDPDDYPQERTAYALRAPDRLVHQAVLLGDHVGIFAQRLLSGPLPWAKLRQAQKLLRLGERYTAARLDAACARALAFDLIDVRRLERILALALEGAERPVPLLEDRLLVVPPGRFARPGTAFDHRPPKHEEVRP